MHLKSSKVFIITRSTLASLLFKGLATKHTIVKWTINDFPRLLMILRWTLVLSPEWMIWIGHSKELCCWRFERKPLVERMEESWKVCDLYAKKLSYAIGGNMVTWNTHVFVKWKVFADIVGLWMPIWKINF